MLDGIRSALIHHGLDLRSLFKILFKVPRFINESMRFRAIGGKIDGFFPVYDEDNGNACSFSDYTILDFLAVREIKSRLITRHLDIGSRVDGLVLQLSHFCDVQCLDIRPNHSLEKFGITTMMADACISPPLTPPGFVKYSSISSIHAVEHMGLGRYGDSIDPFAVDKFIANVNEYLLSNGFFFLGFPCGDNKIMFNAHRLMKPSYYIQKLLPFFSISHAYLVTSTSAKSIRLWDCIPYNCQGTIYQFDGLCRSACLLVCSKKC
jgi:hypothetical protein